MWHSYCTTVLFFQRKKSPENSLPGSSIVVIIKTENDSVGYVTLSIVKKLLWLPLDNKLPLTCNGTLSQLQSVTFRRVYSFSQHNLSLIYQSDKLICCRQPITVYYLFIRRKYQYEFDFALYSNVRLNKTLPNITQTTFQVLFQLNQSAATNFPYLCNS